MSSAEAPGFLIGSPIAGMITQAAGGSYTPAFILSGAVLGVSTALLVLVLVVPKPPALLSANDPRAIEMRKTMSSWSSERSRASMASTSSHASQRSAPDHEDDLDSMHEAQEDRRPLVANADG